MDEKSRLEEAYLFFCRKLRLLHHVLTHLYQLTGEEADLVEQGLCRWFHRYVLRPGIDEVPVASLRLALLVATCQAGLAFATAKLDGARCEDLRLARILGRNPEDVAEELERQFKRARARG